MAQCKVWLENYHTGHYFPGSQIQGKVVLNFTSETKCRSVKLRLLGLEHTEWMGTEEYTEPGSNEKKTRDVRIEGNNEFFGAEIILYGAQTGTTTLSAGQHIYPFTFALPNEIPASYTCEYGSVLFKVVAIVDRPMAFDYKDEIIFMVVSLVDLNNLRRPDLLEPSSYSDDKTVCCLCCAQGPITLDVSLPKKTLVPEETVNVSVRMTNMSNTNIEGVDLTLKQSIKCNAGTEHRSMDNILVSLNEVGLGAHGEHTYTFPVKLSPGCTVPNFALCKLFTVDYHYTVTAKLPGVHSNLEIKMNISVGNIDIGQHSPIGGYQPPPVTTYPMAQQSYQGAYPVTQYPATGGGEAYPQYPQGGGAPSYPSSALRPFNPPPPEVYPGGNYGGGPAYPPDAPAPSLTGYPSKAQEAAGYPSAPAPTSPQQQFPPSYDSIQKQ